MKPLLFFFLFIDSFLGLQKINSQDITDYHLVKDVFRQEKQLPEYKEYIKDNRNEIEWMVSGLLLFYKSFISSQDGNRCVFYPSCSVYTIQAIKIKGPIKGFAAGMDRLCRCNRLSPEKYTKYSNTNLFSDPVK
jgi:uncharacterized protein